jgi:hypothetical protein
MRRKWRPYDPPLFDPSTVPKGRKRNKEDGEPKRVRSVYNFFLDQDERETLKLNGTQKRHYGWEAAH